MSLRVPRALVCLASLVAFVVGAGAGCGSGGDDPSASPEGDAVRVNGIAVGAAELHRGGLLFGMHCASCHGPGGDGRGRWAGRLHTAPADLRTGTYARCCDVPGSRAHGGEGIAGGAAATVDQVAAATAAYLAHVIRHGIAGTDMPAREISDPDLRTLTTYVLWLAPTNRTPTTGSGPPSVHRPSMP